MLKKRYLFLILIVCLFSVSAVSAIEMDNNANMQANDYDSGLMAEYVDKNLLSDSYGTFQELQDEIDAVEEGGTLNLTRNYKYVNGSTASINISKPIIIDGQMHTIEGIDDLKYGTIISFSIDANNVSLKNTNFINFKDFSDEGIVRWNGNNGILTNCNFTKMGYYHGAIVWNGDNGFINNSNFRNNYADLGAAVHWLGNNGRIYSCNFTNNIAGMTAIVSWHGEKGLLYDCIFSNNTGDGSGNSVLWGSKNGCLNKCSFINNYGCSAVDIGQEYTNCSIVNCFFVNNSANEYYGGAISCYSELSSYILNSTFINNSALEGGAIYCRDNKNGIISNCTFINNSADLGRSIYWTTYMDWKPACGSLINNSYSSDYDNVYAYGDNLTIIKKDSKFDINIISSEFPILIESYLIGKNENLIIKPILIEISNKNTNNSFSKYTDDNGRVNFTDLDVGTWNVTYLFEGNDNYYPCNATATITVLPPSTSLTIADVNATVGYDVVLSANVNSPNNLTIDEGFVSFYINDEFIGDASVSGGVASLTYEILEYGDDYTITAIYNGNNYLSSNSTAKLFVDPGNINTSKYSSFGTFKALSKLIDNTAEGDVLTLTKDYIYISGSNDGLGLANSITIDGKGHIIDGNNMSRIFYIIPNNVILKNITFINALFKGDGGAIKWSGSNGTLNSCNFINCSNCINPRKDSYHGGALYVGGKNMNISYCNFINNHAWDGAAMDIYRENSFVSYCNFINNSAEDRSGAISVRSDNHKFFNCNFINNTAKDMAGVMESYGDSIEINECLFLNNSAEDVGAVSLDGYDNHIYGCIFKNNFAKYCGALYFPSCYDSYVVNCMFINNYATNHCGAFRITNCDNIYINNCDFINNTAPSYRTVLLEVNEDIYLSYCNFYPEFDNIDLSGDENINIIKKNSYLILNNYTCNYNEEIMGTALLKNYNNTEFLSNYTIIFKLTNGVVHNNFYSKSNNEGIIQFPNELSQLKCGIWNVTVIFNGNDNYYPCNATAIITVLPQSSSLTIEDVNTTVGHDITLVANVTSDLSINEGIVTFYDSESQIGQSQVTNGIATLSYIPITDGEHIITAVFNSNNYLSSNNTAKLLVDSATVDVLVDAGVVGFNSTFIVNVKGLYSTVNDGNVKFYVDNDYLGEVPVVNGSVSIDYVPLIVGNHIVNVIYCDSEKFIDDEDSTDYYVLKADTVINVNDLYSTVGHDITITSTVTSSNNIIINEGYVTFYDGDEYIGESYVTNGKATLTYTPTTAGDHTITAIFNSDNYLSSNDTAVLSVEKANVDLAIADIASVYFTNPSYFAVNVNSNYKAVNEGKIKYYVNDDLVATADVYGGAANLDYVTTSAGTFLLTAVYDENDNYLASNATAIFTVNKMPTVLSAESLIFDEKGDKIFTAELKDDNSNGVSGQNVKIETIKYSGESRTFNGITDMNGIAEYDVKNLEGGMWFVIGTYTGNENYINSKFTDKFIVVRIDTTTNIEGIDDHPTVNHTYKLKANIHDENGKLVKEGIVQFYLDGVDIGSIDLSKNQGHQSTLQKGLLGAANPAFNYILSEEDEDLYLEFTPTEAGNFTLSAVYEGTTLYKSSTSETDFIVKESWMDTTELITSDVKMAYKGYGELIVTLMDDDTGKVIGGADLTVTLNNVDYALKTDSAGQASLSIPSSLSPKTYVATISYAGNEIYASSNTTANIVVTKAGTVISAPDVSVAYKDPNGELVATITNEHGKALVVNLNVNFNGVDYVVRTDSNGQASIPIGNLTPGKYSATISYKGSSNYKASTATAKVTVTKSGTIISAPDVNIAYKDPNGELVATIINEHGKALVVNLNVNFNGVDYVVRTDSECRASIPIGTLSPGKYSATISYKGSSNYKASTETAKVTVTKSGTVISAPDVKIAYKDPNGELVSTITNEHGKPLVVNLNVELNGKTYTVRTDSEGQASIPIDTLTPGTYTATISYKGSSNYKATSTTAKVTVTKSGTVISAPDVNVAYKDPNGEVVATITNEHGKPLVVNLNVELNGKTYTVRTDSNGQVSIPIDTLAPGKYSATISYKGSSNYKATSTTAKVTVTKSATVISAPNVNIAYKDPNGELVATITNEHGKPLVVNLNVNINGKDFTVRTDSNGQASLAIDTLTPGTYTATISYKGSSNYKASTTTAKVTVTKSATVISAPDVSVSYGDSNGKLVSTITNEHGKPLVVNLNVDLNGKTYTAKTDSNGQISVSTADLAPGTYTAAISYKGSSNYKATSTTAKIVVKQ